MEDAADPFAALKDIHIPLEPEFWPPAPGWWIVALVVLLLGWYLAGAVMKYFRRIQPAREIRKQLLSINIEGSEDNRILAVQKMSKLVRQYAIHRYSRQQVASLFGNNWLEFLDGTGKKSTRENLVFSRGIGKVLGEAQYSKHFEVDLEKLRQLLLVWSKSQ